MECPICYDSLFTNESDTDVETVTELACGHLYHVNCINKWSDINNTCPICREIINTKKECDITEDHTYVNIIATDNVVIEVNNQVTVQEDQSIPKFTWVMTLLDIILIILLISTFIANLIFQDKLLNKIQNYVDAGNSKTIVEIINSYLYKIEIGLMIFLILIKCVEFKIGQQLASLITKLGLISAIFIFHIKYNTTINDYFNDDSNLIKYDNIKDVLYTYKLMWSLVVISFTLLSFVDIVNFIHQTNFTFMKNCILFCCINIGFHFN
jgi:hypothetical protein